MDLLELIESACRKRVLFVGERIVDVYHYGALLGRPLKEPIVCIMETGTDVFDGGVTAAALHAAHLVAEYAIHSSITVTKERWLDESHKRKLFECYRGIVHEEAIWPELSGLDAVIVTDYGHGMMDAESIEKVQQARFLAVNVQTNAGNFGFNLATKYRQCDYICVDEPEARLATQNQTGPISTSLLALARIGKKVVITLGRNGAIGWSEESGEIFVPAYTDRIVDTMGAGDAFFAVTACIAEEASIKDLLKIGNAAGALKTQIVGHRESVTKEALIGYLRANKVC